MRGAPAETDPAPAEALAVPISHQRVRVARSFGASDPLFDAVEVVTAGEAGADGRGDREGTASGRLVSAHAPKAPDRPYASEILTFKS